ncbi:peptidylprolyl isomerase [Kroppenstedtia eburnea]|uniref:peptidylprolyl isomerase n=1 Tax=Kroppenstedtia eburnea TaxID=714067 RepID=UPI00363D1EF9
MQPMNKRLLTVLSAFLAVSLLVAGCGTKDDKNGQETAKDGQATVLPTDSKKVVAEYEGGKVTEGELNTYLNIMALFQPQMAAMMEAPEVKKEIVKNYIAEQMVAKRVKNGKKYEKQAEESLKQFEEQLKQMPAEGKDKDKKKQDLEGYLKEHGFTKGQLKDFLEKNNKVSAYFEDRVNEKDLKKQYNKSDDFYNIKLRHILISTTEDPEGKKKKRSDKDAKARAEKVKKELEGGKKFSDMAKKYSDDPGSKAQGGEMEGTPDQWVPEFSKAAVKTPVDKISDPIKSDYGYHIIQVTERKKLSFDKVKEEMMGQKVTELYQAFIKDEVKVTKLDIPGDKKKK